MNTTDKINSTVSGGILETYELKMPQFDDGRIRTIRVWIPDGYDEKDKSVKYPVLYMHDGQNLFDDYTSFVGEWHVDETLTELFKAGFRKTIVVGIDNGGAYRFNELSPEWSLNDLGKEYITEPAGSKYADFVMNTVKPFIDEHYNTDPDRKYTGVGGSSMGGAISYFMALKYSDKIGYAIVLSPGVHVYDEESVEQFVNSTVSREYRPLMYIYAGDSLGNSEKGSVYDETLFTKYVEILKKYLIDNGYDEKLIGTHINKNSWHNEGCWADEFPLACSWVMNALK